MRAHVQQPRPGKKGCAGERQAREGWWRGGGGRRGRGRERVQRKRAMARVQNGAETAEQRVLLLFSSYVDKYLLVGNARAPARGTICIGMHSHNRRCRSARAATSEATLSLAVVPLPPLLFSIALFKPLLRYRPPGARMSQPLQPFSILSADLPLVPWYTHETSVQGTNWISPSTPR